MNNEVNEINNVKLKEEIANKVVAMLADLNKIEEEDLVNFKIDFGYIFTKTNGELEGLLKCITNNKGNFYIAIQKNKFMLVNLTEEIYIDTINNMKRFHSCLNI